MSMKFTCAFVFALFLSTITFTQDKSYSRNAIQDTSIYILPSVYFLEIVNNSPQTLFATVIMDDSFRKSTDNGKTWEIVEVPLREGYPDATAKSISVNPFDNNIAFLITNGKPAIVMDLKTYKTVNGCNTWMEVVNSNGRDFSRIQYHPHIPGIVFAASWDQIYKSTDGGQNFRLVSEGNYETIDRFYFNPFDHQTIFCNVLANGGIIKSTDMGESWNSASEGLIHEDDLYNWTTDIANASGEELYCSQLASYPIQGGLFKSTNLGSQWIKVDSALATLDHQLSMTGIAINSSNPDRIFVSLRNHGQPGTSYYSNGGLFFTENAGKSWEKLYDGPVEFVDIDNSDPPNVYFNTTENGLMRLTDTLTVSVEDELQNIPAQFSLSQNYPNPFNPTTKIKYTIPTPPFLPPLAKGRDGVGLFVILKIYDILGREITTLVNEAKVPGTYEVEFKAPQLPSGVYFYKLTAGRFAETKKMLLLK